MFPVSSFAQSVDIQSQMIALLQQIVQLQTQLITSLTSQIGDLQQQLTRIATVVPAPQPSIHYCTIIDPPQCAMALHVFRDDTNCVTGYACPTPPLPPAKQNQTISIAQIGTTATYNETFTISATASSNLPVTFTASGACTVSGNTVHIGYGSYGPAANIQTPSLVPSPEQTQSALMSAYAVIMARPINVFCSITAHQGGSDTWNPAPDVTQTFTVNYPYPTCGGNICAAAKPVIYLYPTHDQETKVMLDYKGRITSSYPTYNDSTKGWNVIAHPDGTLTNLADHKEYSYLFWEGDNYPLVVDETQGFVVKGSDTKAYLQSTLSHIGLTPREYNEFIVYWLPKMEHNPYNFIQFVGKEYTDMAPLSISPTPDSVLRVFMAWKPLLHNTNVTPQVITTFDRKGFTVLEWGGTELP